MQEQKRTLYLFLLLAAAVFAGVAFGFSETERVQPLDAGERPEKAREVTVYVCGAVNRPGVVRLSEEGRVVDAVGLCGGVLPTADTLRVNMAQPLKDGMQITVPEKALTIAAGEVAPPSKDQKAKTAELGDKVNINTADAAALDALPGVGPALAQAIVAYREENGLFSAPEDLMKVRGIGAAKFKKLEARISL